jgi:GT2 family glycosyltransferase
MALRRSLAQRIGWFDERFGAGAVFQGAEDTDYLYRAHRAGVAIEYVPDMIVYHQHGRKWREQITRLNHAYDFGNGAFYAKHMRRDPRVLRYGWWDLKACLLELAGRIQVDPVWCFTYRAKVASNTLGMARFMISTLLAPGDRTSRRDRVGTKAAANR